MKYLLLACVLTGCGWFEKDNKPTPKKSLSELQDRDRIYCSLSETLYNKYDKTIEPNCDAALFTSLHGVQCDYVDPSNFEFEKSGKLCRRPGCTCFDYKTEGHPNSESGYSKDMATGQQLYYSVFPDKDLARRVQAYGNTNDWFVCNASDTPTSISRCLMSPKIIYRWAEIEKKGAEQELEGIKNQPDEEEKELKLNTDFRGHLDILGIITEYNLYGGISDKSIKVIREQSQREPNNLLYQAMSAKFINGNEEEIAGKLLEKFPSDRLPNTSDWCTDYLFQRDELRNGSINSDWLPCPEENRNHPGTDYLLASWVLQLGE